MSDRTGLHHVAFYPSDWLAGTRGLSALETGVYITIIAMLYERGEPLDMDQKRLARLCGTTPKTFEKAVDFLVEEGKLTRRNEGLWNFRVEKELKKAREKSNVASESAKKRWEKNQKNQHPDYADAVPEHSEGYTSARVNQNQNQTLDDDGGSARAREAGFPQSSHPPGDPPFREKLLTVCGVDPVSGLTGHGGSQLGTGVQMDKLREVMAANEVSEQEVLNLAPEVLCRKRDPGPPSSLAFFTKPIERYAADRASVRAYRPPVAASQGSPPAPVTHLPPRVRARPPKDDPDE